MSRKELLAKLRDLNRRFETSGDALYDDNEALHSQMDELLLAFAGADVETEFGKHGKWYA